MKTQTKQNCRNFQFFGRYWPPFKCFGLVAWLMISFSCTGLATAKIDWELSEGLAATAGMISEEAWYSDLDFLVKRLESAHPKPWHSISREDFLSCLYAELPETSSPDELGERRAARLFRAMALIGEGHSGVITIQAFKRRLPLVFSRGSDGYYIMAVGLAAGQTELPIEQAALLAGRLESLAGIGVTELERRLLAYAPGESLGFKQETLATLLPIVGLLLDAGIIARDSKSLEITVKRPDGSSTTAELDFWPTDTTTAWIDAFSQAGVEAPESLSRTDEAYWWRVSGAPVVAYFQYNSCTRLKDQPFEVTVREFFKAAETNNAIALVLDLRHNGGGDSSIFSFGFLPVLKQSAFRNNGQLFVLIGPRVFSSAIFAVYELDQQTDAIFIGEATGQGINHYGYTGYAMLPASGFVVFYSTTYWELKKGDKAKTFEPDLRVHRDIPAILEGRDPQLEAALRAALEAAR